MRLRNDIYDVLNEDLPDLNLYQTVGNYIKAIIEDYALQDFYTREEIYYRQLYERVVSELNALPEEKALLHIRYLVSDELRDFRVKPYRMSYVAESQFHYLIGLSKDMNNEESEYSPAVFRLSRIKSISRTPSYGSPKITHKELMHLISAINERGVQFLLSEPVEYKIKLTPQGVVLYNTILHLRPIADPSKTTSDDEGNVTMRFISTFQQISNYFFQFGKDALILSPSTSTLSFQDRYREAYEAYTPLLI